MLARASMGLTLGVARPFWVGQGFLGESGSMALAVTRPKLVHTRKSRSPPGPPPSERCRSQGSLNRLLLKPC